MRGQLEVIPLPGFGAEDVVVGADGRHEGAVFTGMEDGSILRVSHDGDRITRVADTGGRPLGLEIAPDGRLLVCDAVRGVLRVDVDRGHVEVAVSTVDGVPMRFCNNAAVTGDGDVWFSDSSTQYGVDEWKDDFVQDTHTGRLLRLPAGGSEAEVVLDGLRFSNGVALAADESWVAVAECAGRTVVRHWLTGPRAGERDHLATDLPGYPDNISRGSDGLVWVALASPTDPVVERLHRAPLAVRRVVTRIPERLQPAPKRTVRAQAYDGTRLVHDLDLPADDFHMATGVREHEGRVWFGSLHEPAVAVTGL